MHSEIQRRKNNLSCAALIGNKVMSRFAQALLKFKCRSKINISQGSGCRSVVGAVACDMIDPRFKPRHRQSFIPQIIYQLYPRKDKTREKYA